MDNVKYQPQPDGEIWKVERFDLLASEFLLTEESLPAFHATAMTMPGWIYLRAHFGINPVTPLPGTDERLRRPWSLREMGKHPELFPVPNATAVSYRRKLMGRDIEEIKVLWLGRSNKAARDKQRNEDMRAPREKADAPPLPLALSDDDDTLLKRYGFGPATFGHAGRDEVEAMAEREWFVNRLRETKRLFDEPSISFLARGSLLSEMYLRRIDSKICLSDPGTEEFDALQNTRSGIESEYRKTQKKIAEAVPWAGEPANKVRVQGVLSNFIDGIRDAVGHGDKAMLDGLSTVYEVQVELRASSQHDIRYSAGQEVSFQEAIAGLENTKLRGRLPDVMCRMMDAGFEEAEKRVRESQPPKIESDGPAAEQHFPPSDANGDCETTEPAINVPLSSDRLI